MTLTGLSYLFSNFVWIWLLVAFIGGLVWGWLTSDKSAGIARWFGAGLWIWIILLAVAVLIAAVKLIPGKAGLWFDTAVLFTASYFVGCLLGGILSVLLGGAAQPVSASAGAVTGNSPAPSAPSLARVTPYQWQAQKDANQITLTGFVPSERVRTDIVDQARKAFRSGSISDRLKLAEGAPSGLGLLAGAALGHLGLLDKGIASLIDSSYTLTGQATSQSNKAKAEAAAAMLPSGFRLAKVDVLAPPTVKATETVPVAVVATSAVSEETNKPVGLTGPRGGKGDDLKRIRGIGKQNEGRLHGLGIWHFDQIAGWTKNQVEWVGAFLAFPGRIEREEWVSQAKLLARGEETAFSKRVDAGEVATSKDDGHDGRANIETAAGGQFGSGTRPKGLSAPRPGKKDDLKLINGVGRTIETKLHAVGIYHFDQLAGMNADELGWISHHVGFPGRAIRENWAGESRILASGGETDHSKAVKAGKVKSSLDDPKA